MEALSRKLVPKQLSQLGVLVHSRDCDPVEPGDPVERVAGVLGDLQDSNPETPFTDTSHRGDVFLLAEKKLMI